MEKITEQGAAQGAEQTAEKIAQAPAKKPAIATGRNKMTLAECKRLGLDPRPYGLLSKKAAK